MRGVFRVVQRIAPKRKFGSVRVRREDGRLLTKAEQFHELYQYFSEAFRCSDQPDFQSSCADPCFGEPEIVQAIQQLKNAKAVPRSSPVAEVWKHCPHEFAAYFEGIFRQNRQAGSQLPTAMTDCTLTLLPKPNKPLRRPQDLRPLGLQDPSSKVLAGLVQNRLFRQVQGLPMSKPQFAYAVCICRRSLD